MLRLGQRGVAGLIIAVAAVAIAGASVGAPVAVDSMVDQRPGSPFYGLERAGERIKQATFARGQDWELARAGERTREFQNLAKMGRAGEHMYLIEDAGGRLIKAAKKADDNKALQRTLGAFRRHVEALEKVRENVPDVAKPAISLAISRGLKSRMVLKDVKTGKLSSSAGGGMPGLGSQKLGLIQSRMGNLRDEIRDNMDRGVPPSKISQNLEIDTAVYLAGKFIEMVRENRGGNYDNLLGEVGDRLDAASVAAADNEGLERAIQASGRHLSVLENIYEKVPLPAKPAIALAISRSSRHLQILENLKEGRIYRRGEFTKEFGKEPRKGERYRPVKFTEECRKALRNRLEEVKENIREERNRFREKIREAAGNPEEIRSIMKEYESRLRGRLELMRVRAGSILENGSDDNEERSLLPRPGLEIPEKRQ